MAGAVGAGERKGGAGERARVRLDMGDQSSCTVLRGGDVDDGADDWRKASSSSEPPSPPSELSKLAGTMKAGSA